MSGISSNWNADCDVSLQQLSHSTRHDLGLYLNPIKQIRGNDWRAVADRIGCSQLEIENITAQPNPMEAVMSLATGKAIRLAQFLRILEDIERFDVLEACNSKIEQDVRRLMSGRE